MARFLVSILLVGFAFTTAALGQPPAPEAPLTKDEIAAVKASEDARIHAIESVYGAVVAIYGNDRGGGGSGVLFDPSGLALTNHHVVAAAGTEGWAGLADGKLYRWRIIGTDPGGDVAIIQLLGKDKFPVAPLGNSNTVRVGDFAMAMGNPFVLAEDQRPTVTLGMVSGIERYQPGAGDNMLVYGNCIQVDSSINPGNSGGPLFDLHGEVIGINGRGSFKERGRVNVGLGYAISVNQVKNFVPDLLATKMAQHGTLDALFGNRGNEVICHTLNLDSKIADMGLQLGDKLIAFEGQTVTNANQFTNLITTLPAGWPCEVTYEHDGKQSTIHVRLTPLPYGAQQQPMAKEEEKKDEEKKDDKKEEKKADDKKEEGNKDEKKEGEEPSDKEKPADEEKKPEEKKADEEKKPEEKKPDAPKPMEIKLPMQQRPNFGAAGEVRDEALNRENAKRVMARWREFSGVPNEQPQGGWKIVDKIARGDQQVGQQTLHVARDGRFNVDVTLEGKHSRFGYDGTEFWTAVGDDEPSVVDAERLARNPFAAQGYVLATLQTKEPLATIGKVVIDAGDKAGRQLAYRLKAIDEKSDEFFVWLSVLDAAGHPQVRLLKTSEAYEEERTTGMLYDGWKEAGGVQFPHRRTVVSGLAETVALQITTSEIDVLEQLEDSLFQKPNHGSETK
jgi:serine protease Do